MLMFLIQLLIEFQYSLHDCGLDFLAIRIPGLFDSMLTACRKEDHMRMRHDGNIAFLKFGSTSQDLNLIRLRLECMNLSIYRYESKMRTVYINIV